MDWLLENLKLVVVLAVVVGSLVKKVLEASNTNKPAEPLPDDRLATHEKAKPAEMRHAAPQRQAAGPPPLRQVTLPVERGALQTEVARQRELQERLRKIRDAKAHPAIPAAIPAAAPTVLKRPTISGGLRGQMRSSKELRRAVILREILGPPVGLR